MITLSSMPIMGGAVEGVTSEVHENAKFFTYSDRTYGIDDEEEKIKWDKYGLPIETTAEGINKETQQPSKSTLTFTYELQKYKKRPQNLNLFSLNFAENHKIVNFE